MKLTKTERWILSNQYTILELLDPNEKEYYENCRQVLDRGYELHYDWTTEYIYSGDDILSEDECREVIDILDMFSTLGRFYDQLEQKPKIEEWMIRFSGFDGNNEGKQLSYARFFCSYDGGRFNDLERPEDFNSHMPTLDAYRRMLLEWKASMDKYHLTSEDLLRISSARIHPDA